MNGLAISLVSSLSTVAMMVLAQSHGFLQAPQDSAKAPGMVTATRFSLVDGGKERAALEMVDFGSSERGPGLRLFSTNGAEVARFQIRGNGRPELTFLDPKKGTIRVLLGWFGGDEPNAAMWLADEDGGAKKVVSRD